MEDDAFLARAVSVIPGKRIGAGSLIGAGSVVLKNFPAGVTVFGKPTHDSRKEARMKARIAAMDYALPQMVLTKEQPAHDHSDRKVEKMSAKMGISSRHVAAEDEYTSDLAMRAASI